MLTNYLRKQTPNVKVTSMSHVKKIPLRIDHQKVQQLLDAMNYGAS